MNVLLIAQCQKNALKETRHILDQFAERKGDRTWQTAITQAGLTTLRKLLRQRARRNTAVACHWIRGKDHSELLWIVGNASRFSETGTVPTNITRRNLLRHDDENTWHSLDRVRWLASMAALFHDLGKATDAFQERLRGQRTGKNRYRHEWVSLRLLEAFVDGRSDAEWLKQLSSEAGATPHCWLESLCRDGLDTLDLRTERTPFKGTRLPPLAQAIGWLILSHHRLPLKPSHAHGEQRWLGSESAGWQDELLHGLDNVAANWNECERDHDGESLAPWWQCSRGLPVSDADWHRRARRLVKQAFDATWWNEPAQAPLDAPYLMHLARLCLMMADHHYSSQQTGQQTNFLSAQCYANTLAGGGTSHDDMPRRPNQTLTDHLLGVTRCTGEVAHRLPTLVTGLRGLTQHRAFRKRSRQPRFRWQDKAFDLAASLQERSQQQGFFGVNMASTGCGKTLANGRIMYALGHPRRGARFTIAMGLRTLTLQTGEAYRQHLQLSEQDLAVRVGGRAQMALYEHARDQESASGSSSDARLLDDGSTMAFADRLDTHPLLRSYLHDAQAQQFVSAPLMACTIDHLMPATESLRGGHQIAPMLRLMTSDLILDEPDDFGLEDLPALTRLVYWTGLLGARVLLSSATLPPTLVQGLFEAYQAGRAEFQRHRGDPAARPGICCAWFDEQGCHRHDCADEATFKAQHAEVTTRRLAFLEHLSTQHPLRVGRLTSMPSAMAPGDTIYPALAQLLRNEAEQLHAQHAMRSPGGQRVSVGLIRMANINPLVDVARHLFALPAHDTLRIHICVYHSQFPLLMRSRKERMLDSVLARGDAQALFTHPAVQPLLDAAPDQEHLFIVLGSPITEVGRDHDYDWAIVEPSSIRSIIQLAGRLQRHRQQPPATPNLVLLDTNVKGLSPGQSSAIFTRPGFEDTHQWRLATHSLGNGLLPDDFLDAIDARPRLFHRFTKPRRSTQRYLAHYDTLNSLEHQRIAYTMLARFQARYPSDGQAQAGAFSAYHTPRAMLTGMLPQHQPFRAQDGQQSDLALLLDEDQHHDTLCDIIPSPGTSSVTYSSVNHLRRHEALPMASGIDAWGDQDYAAAVIDLAAEMGIPPEHCAKRFGRITLRTLEHGREYWRYHPVMGFSQQAKG